MIDLFFALSPLLVIVGTVIVMGRPAHVGGAAGWLTAVAAACLYFHTDFAATLKISLAGAAASLPITATLIAAMLQVAIMEETGAIKRISVLFKCFSKEDKAVRVLFLAIALSTLLCTIGAVPIVLLPTVLLALGYRVHLAIALPIMGYAGTCVFALLGVPADYLARFAEVSVYEAFAALSKFMFSVNFATALCCLWVAGKFELVKKGFIPSLLTGLACYLGVVVSARLGFYPITGILMSLLMLAFFVIYLAARGLKVYDHGCLDDSELASEKRLSLARAFSPWLGLCLAVIVINVPQLPFHGLIAMPMPVEIIPGRPEKLRLFSQAYFWVILMTLICTPLMKPRPGDLARGFKKWRQRALKPCLASLSFFALAYIFNHSGTDAAWRIDPANNMMLITAEKSSEILGAAYGACAPLIGLLGGILASSQSAVVALFTGLHIKAAALTGGTPLLVAAASTIGAGLASLVSPVKILSAAAALDSEQRGAGVLRSLLALSMLISLAASANYLLLEWLDF